MAGSNGKLKARIRKITKLANLTTEKQSARTSKEAIWQPVVLCNGYGIFLKTFLPPRRLNYGEPKPLPRMHFPSGKKWKSVRIRQKVAMTPGIIHRVGTFTPIIPKAKIRELRKGVLYHADFFGPNVAERLRNITKIAALPEIWKIVHPYFQLPSHPLPTLVPENMILIPIGDQGVATISLPEIFFEEEGAISTADILKVEKSKQMVVPVIIPIEPMPVPVNFYGDIMFRRPLAPSTDLKKVSVTSDRVQGNLVKLDDVFPLGSNQPIYVELTFYYLWCVFPLLMERQPGVDSEKYAARWQEMELSIDELYHRRFATLKIKVSSLKKAVCTLLEEEKKMNPLFTTFINDPTFDPLKYPWNKRFLRK